MNTPAIMTGWGQWNMSHDHISESLKNLPTKIQSDEACQLAAANITQTVVKGHTFCAGRNLTEILMASGWEIAQLIKALGW